MDVMRIFLTVCVFFTAMSFKGHWRAENKALVELEIPLVVLPKLGKQGAKEKGLENSPKSKSLKNKHSAIESNINELEHCGLDRCPDRSYFHYRTYIALGVCAYNLKKEAKRFWLIVWKNLCLEK